MMNAIIGFYEIDTNSIVFWYNKNKKDKNELGFKSTF
jgi:hypothetical protein